MLVFGECYRIWRFTVPKTWQLKINRGCKIDVSSSEKKLPSTFQQDGSYRIKKNQETKDISKPESNPNQQKLVVKISDFKHFHNFSSLSSDVRNYQPRSVNWHGGTSDVNLKKRCVFGWFLVSVYGGLPYLLGIQIKKEMSFMLGKSRLVNYSEIMTCSNYFFHWNCEP